MLKLRIIQKPIGTDGEPMANSCVGSVITGSFSRLVTANNRNATNNWWQKAAIHIRQRRNGKAVQSSEVRANKTLKFAIIQK